MQDCMEQQRPVKYISKNTDVILELAFELRDISQNLAKIERSIESDQAAVSDHQNELLHKQAEAMRVYKAVLGKRIKDLIDG